MNVEPSSWASQVPNPQKPLSTGLRRAFAAELRLPAEMLRLLRLLDHPIAVS